MTEATGEPSRIRRHCPLGACRWVHDDAWADVPDRVFSDAETFSALQDHQAAVNVAIYAHLETHSLLEWAHEVARLREVIDLTAIALSDSGQMGAFLKAATAPGSPAAAVRRECLRRLA